MKKTSTFQNGLIWFGAGVSLAEILTGTAFAPLGMAKGLAAIVIGHIIGCAMMLLAGLIGGRTGRSAMETVKMSFGQKGGLLFAFLNVLQLVGWTAIMIYDGALAIGGHALELAAPHQRLHPGGRKAGPGHLGQRGGVWPGVLLDVCHRHGRGDLYRGV